MMQDARCMMQDVVFDVDESAMYCNKLPYATHKLSTENLKL